MKRAALINDLCGFGKTSLVVSIPILTVMGIDCSPMPTAILSSHTGYSEFFFDDYTEKMDAYQKKWQALNVKFDMIYSGFLGSEKQIHIISDMADAFSSPLLIDPVMGDNGKIYVPYTEKMCNDMKHLCEKADIITPNLTEACLLSGAKYMGEDISDEYAKEIINRLSDKLKNVGHIVITGIKRDNRAYNAVFDNGSVSFTENRLCGRYFDGTGDVFASIVCGATLCGHGFYDSVRAAADFIEKSAFYSKEMNADRKDGIILSEYICELGKLRYEK